MWTEMIKPITHAHMTPHCEASVFSIIAGTTGIIRDHTAVDDGKTIDVVLTFLKTFLYAGIYFF
jgi:hypothetical protein